MRKLAEHLVSSETKDRASHQSKVEASFTVCEKLRQELVALTGATGFCALLTRTLTLLQQENVLRLGIKRIRVDGSLERVEHVQMADQPEAPENDPVILPAQLLDLLAAFIGEPLTLRIVENIWPGLEIASLQTVHTKPTEAAQT